MDQTCDMGVALLSLQRDKKHLRMIISNILKIATEYVGIEGGEVGIMSITLVGMMYLDSVH